MSWYMSFNSFLVSNAGVRWYYPEHVSFWGFGDFFSFHNQNMSSQVAWSFIIPQHSAESPDCHLDVVTLFLTGILLSP